MLRQDDLIGKRVRIYRNLRKNCYSVQYKGRVVRHVDGFLLDDVRFIVRPAGWRRTVETKQKTVHAFIEGVYKGVAVATDIQRNNIAHWAGKVSYNPYSCSYFTYVKDRRPVKDGGQVVGFPFGVYKYKKHCVVEGV